MGQSSVKDRPTLEELRGKTEPAWLWDPLRLRIVWANEPGIAFFGCETLFDLIDRPFATQEPGVAEIDRLGRALRHGAAESVLLEFPSAADAPVSCVCHAHALPDGRKGILAMVRAATAGSGPRDREVAAGFDSLPTAAIIAGPDGKIVHANPAASDLLGGEAPESLVALLGGGGTTREFLTRLARAGVLSLTRQIELRAGTRDVRIAARLGEGGQAVLTLDDVTDRRALERQLAAPAIPARIEPPGEPPPVALTIDDQAAFQELGRKLTTETPRTVEKTETPPVPDFIKLTLDRFPGANVFAKDGRLIHASPAALVLLGFDNPNALAESPAGSVLAALPPVGGECRIVRGDGTGLTVRSAGRPVPWLGGPAICFGLEVVAEAVPPVAAPVPEVSSAAPRVPEASKPGAAAAHVEVQPEPAPRPEPEPMRAAAPAAADESLRAILDTVADGIVTIDGEGRVRSFSAGAESIFGVRSAEILDSGFAALFAPNSRKTVRDYLAAMTGPGLGAVFNDGREVTAIEKRGGEVPLFLTIGKLDPGQAGGAVFCAVVRDITQWKKTEADLRDARDRAEEASRQKSEFLAKVSHELRTPLNAILGFSEVMRLERFGEMKNDRYSGYVNDIHSSGSHLLSLINDLLDLAKVESGNLELDFTAVGLGDVVDHAMKLVQEDAQRGRVLLRKSVQAGLPNIVADLRSMRQIVLNLLSNAVKFTDPGGQIVVSAQLSKEGELVFRVKDTGVGMTAEQIRDALEPYKRVVTEGREAPGTGLGLPLTRALVEANRASFKIESEPRKGTLIEVVFPVNRVLAE